MSENRFSPENEQEPKPLSREEITSLKSGEVVVFNEISDYSNGDPQFWRVEQPQSEQGRDQILISRPVLDTERISSVLKEYYLFTAYPQNYTEFGNISLDDLEHKFLDGYEEDENKRGAGRKKTSLWHWQSRDYDSLTRDNAYLASSGWQREKAVEQSRSLVNWWMFKGEQELREYARTVRDDVDSLGQEAILEKRNFERTTRLARNHIRRALDVLGVTPKEALWETQNNATASADETLLSHNTVTAPETTPRDPRDIPSDMFEDTQAMPDEQAEIEGTVQKIKKWTKNKIIDPTTSNYTRAVGVGRDLADKIKMADPIVDSINQSIDKKLSSITDSKGEDRLADIFDKYYPRFEIPVDPNKFARLLNKGWDTPYLPLQQNLQTRFDRTFEQELMAMKAYAKRTVVSEVATGKLSNKEVEPRFSEKCEEYLNVLQERLASVALVRAEQNAIISNADDEYKATAGKYIDDQLSQWEAKAAYTQEQKRLKQQQINYFKSLKSNLDKNYGDTNKNISNITDTVTSAQKEYWRYNLQNAMDNYRRQGGIPEAKISDLSMQIELDGFNNNIKLIEKLAASIDSHGGDFNKIYPSALISEFNARATELGSISAQALDQAVEAFAEIQLIHNRILAQSGDAIAEWFGQEETTKYLVTFNDAKKFKINNDREKIEAIKDIASKVFISASLAAMILSSPALVIANNNMIEHAVGQARVEVAHQNGLQEMIDENKAYSQMEEDGKSEEEIMEAMFLEIRIKLGRGIIGFGLDELTSSEVTEYYRKLVTIKTGLGDEKFGKLAEDSLPYMKLGKEPGQFFMDRVSQLIIDLEKLESERPTPYERIEDQISEVEKYEMEDIKQDWEKLQTLINKLDSLNSGEAQLDFILREIKPLTDDLTTDYNHLSAAAQRILIHEMWGDYIGKDQLKNSPNHQSKIQDRIDTLILLLGGDVDHNSSIKPFDYSPQPSPVLEFDVTPEKDLPFAVGRGEGAYPGIPDTIPDDGDPSDDPQFGVGRDQNMFNVKPNPDENGDDALGRAA